MTHFQDIALRLLIIINNVTLSIVNNVTLKMVLVKNLRGVFVCMCFGHFFSFNRVDEIGIYALTSSLFVAACFLVDLIEIFEMLSNLFWSLWPIPSKSSPQTFFLLYQSPFFICPFSAKTSYTCLSLFF